MLTGMPLSAPPYVVPKSGCSEVLAPIELMSVAELAATGALVIFSFQGLSAGNSVLPMRLGKARLSSSSTINEIPRLRLDAFLGSAKRPKPR